MRTLMLMLMVAVMMPGCTPTRPPAEAPAALAAPETAPQPVRARRAYAHVMVSFRHRELAGAWQGWNHSNAKVRHDPDQIGTDGQRDIASVFYPLLGPYDMCDPALVEAHCRLAAAAGLDGFIFDVVFGPDREWMGKAVRLYVEAMRRHDLQGAVIYEDKGHWIWNPAVTSRAEAVQSSLQDLNAWLEVMKPVQIRVDGRPLVGFFSYEQPAGGKGVSRLLPGELKKWRDSFPPERQPLLVSSWFKPEYAGVLDGPYDWIWLNGPRSTDGVYSVWMEQADLDRVQADRERQAAEWRGQGVIASQMGGVWPGFDSYGCWGFGGEPQYATRGGGATYRRQWERIMAQDLDLVQVVTWNDWFEGSVIEPSVEDGFRYLELTRELVAKWKGTDPATGRFDQIVADYWQQSPVRKLEARPAARSGM